MAEVSKVTEITMKESIELLRSMGKEKAAEKINEICTHVDTLMNRIADIITEDQIFAAAVDISFVACLTVMGDTAVQQMLGSPRAVSLGVHTLLDSCNDEFTSEEERRGIASALNSAD